MLLLLEASKLKRIKKIMSLFRIGLLVVTPKKTALIIVSIQLPRIQSTGWMIT